MIDGEVKIVDEFTGRIMEGRRWSEGLHQAVEAKEGVRIQEENVTVATVTIQNYFRMYEKLAGMTGTAATEAAEFHEIYDLEVVPIPTNVPVVRGDEDDLIFKTRRRSSPPSSTTSSERHETGQPVLVGTVSVEVSEHLSKLLERQGVPHEVLNAKNHEREAAHHRGRRASPARSRSPPTWPAAASTSSWARASPTWAGCTCWAPSGTSRGASTTSCAAAPAARATRARPASTCPRRTR